MTRPGNSGHDRMQFLETAIDGAYIVELDRHEDERGFFARAFCQKEFSAAGLNPQVVQANYSRNTHAGTVRGMHYQVEPAPETKFVRCVRGSILDVIVDLRESSPTYRSHVSVELSADNGCALFVPALCAHGFQTLEDNADVLYLVSGFYTPDCERGLRHDDPRFSITWPKPITHVSEKDTLWPLWPDSGA